MNNTWENLDLIEAWKNQELSPEEARKLEYEIMHNAEMAKDVETYNRLMEHIETYGNKRTQKTIEKVVSKLENEGFFNNEEVLNSKVETVANLSRWRFRELSIAATFLLVATVMVFQFIPKKSNLPDFVKLKIEEKHLKHTIAILEAPGLASEEGKNDSLSKALKLYFNYDFVNAKLSLLQLVNDYPDDQNAQLYLGLSFLQNSEYLKAVKYLAPLTLADDIEIKNTAKWYATLCYLTFKTEQDKTTALVLLKQLADDPFFPHADYAKAYYDLLNSKK